eukprot:1948396-Prymnesium_polylepis.1
MCGHARLAVLHDRFKRTLHLHKLVGGLDSVRAARVAHLVGMVSQRHPVVGHLHVTCARARFDLEDLVGLRQAEADSHPPRVKDVPVEALAASELPLQTDGLAQPLPDERVEAIGPQHARARREKLPCVDRPRGAVDTHLDLDAHEPAREHAAPKDARSQQHERTEAQGAARHARPRLLVQCVAAGRDEIGESHAYREGSERWLQPQRRRGGSPGRVGPIQTQQRGGGERSESRGADRHHRPDRRCPATQAARDAQPDCDCGARAGYARDDVR